MFVKTLHKIETSSTSYLLYNVQKSRDIICVFYNVFGFFAIGEKKTHRKT